MGLDKRRRWWLNGTMKKFLRALAGFLPHGKTEVRKSPLAVERERFMNEMKDQLLELKAKGLGITVFTL